MHLKSIEREKMNIFHTLVYSTEGNHSKFLARLKMGVRNSSLSPEGLTLYPNHSSSKEVHVRLVHVK